MLSGFALHAWSRWPNSTGVQPSPERPVAFPLGNCHNHLMYTVWSAIGPSKASASSEGLAASLLVLGRPAARALLLKELQAAADPSTITEALLQQPQSQLRSYGLLAARLGGRSDLLLAALKGDSGTWKQAACLLCQVNSCPLLQALAYLQVDNEIIKWHHVTGA